MATKRNKRVDPNAAFAAIVGTGGAGEGAEPTPPGPAEVAPPIAGRPDLPAASAIPVNASGPEKKLVQKGYYLTDEQVRQLGLHAVMTGMDRSSIVRAALDEYFANHPY